jgi:hypothetical protein
MITEFFKHILKVVSYAGGIALIGGAYLLVDSIKNKPLTKDEVTTIVKEEISPVVNLVDTHLKNTISQEGVFKTLENSYIRTLEKNLKDKSELAKYKDEKIKVLEDALKKNENNNYLFWIPDTTRSGMELGMRK